MTGISKAEVYADIWAMLAKSYARNNRDNDRRPKGRDVKQARGASPPEWAEGIAQTPSPSSRERK